MPRNAGVYVLVLVTAVAACDAGPDPADPGTPGARFVIAGSPAEKIGADVLAALDRGEQPAIVVSLAVAEMRDVAALRRAVGSAQDAALRGITPQELEVRRRFAAVPAFSAVARNRGALVRMAANPVVSRIDLDLAGMGTLAESVPLIDADARHTIGNRGAGVVVAILDTGMDTDHPDVADALVGEACFGDDDGSIDGTGFCPGGSDRRTGAGAAEDDAGHGTHVAGIVASNGTVSSPGVAPDAGIVAIKVLDNCAFSGCFSYVSEIVAALDYLIATPQLGVDIINMSLGTNALFTGDCDASTASTQAVAAAVNTLRTNGVVTFASAGNNGSNTQMPLPACVANVVSVGATDDADAIPAFSNITANTDILAPGNNILSLAVGGGTTTASGTSMASPTAAGCAALLLEAGDATTPAEVETRLETSDVTATRGSVTLPRIDCGPDVDVPPSVTVNNATVTVSEGATALNTGTFAEGSGGAVTMSATVGSVVAAAGAWSWSFATTDGPAQSQTVTVTASDADGLSSDVAFSLTVNNVAPTVNAGADVSITSGETLDFSGTFSDPGVNDNPWNWVIAWGFGANSNGSTASQAAAITASRRYCAVGDYVVTLSVTDKDGAVGADSRTVTVGYLGAGIDIMPLDQPNSINLGNGGLMPVAILGSATFNASAVNPASVTLGNESGSDTPVAKRNNGRYYAATEDVNGDGYMDLVLHFNLGALVANGDLTATSTTLVLRGIAGDGCTAFRGSEAVRVVN